MKEYMIPAEEQEAVDALADSIWEHLNKNSNSVWHSIVALQMAVAFMAKFHRHPYDFLKNFDGNVKKHLEILEEKKENV